MKLSLGMRIFLFIAVLFCIGLIWGLIQKPSADTESIYLRSDNPAGEPIPKFYENRQEDTSHGAANRITIELTVPSGTAKDQAKRIVALTTDKYSRLGYDIVWCEIWMTESANLTIKGDDLFCSTKWIRPSLDPMWHTTGDGFEPEDEYNGIGFRWYD